MAETVVIHPAGLSVVRSYLLGRTEVTAITGTRVNRTMPPELAVPRFPAIRLTELTSVELIPRVWIRMLIQVDCWAVTQLAADELGRVVVGVLRASAGYVTPDAALGETQDLAVRAEPDESLTPLQPRSIVTGHAWIRPN